MTVADSAWDEAVTALRDAPMVALSCHVNPDGDALGSMLALTLALRARGTEAIASWSEPFGVPKQYWFLPADDAVSPPEQFPAAPDLMITFDAGSFERLGTLEASARAAKSLIVVDHHASNDHFGDINLIDPNAAASAVLVHELLQRLGAPIDRDIATCLYTGLVTDTGRFQYRNTTPHVHRIAAELLGYGVQHDLITQEIYNTHPTGYLKLLAVALDRLEVSDGIAWTYVTQEDLARNGVGMEDIEAIIDVVRTVDSTDVATVLKEQSDGMYKVSMRSKGASNVGAVAEALGGGGHALAAGFTSTSADPKKTIADIAAALRA
ncbi:MAG TPA: bifunctional oligoribonuclease/PAP phosphatase NrnA [Actinomycetota bacterium]|nr:bifunctional oligoribonuclease/PAP phosphatase NrnA [Actinomycetota bacterium]